jgi:hypothetical protein
MALRITQSNLVGFDPVPGDELDTLRTPAEEGGAGGGVPQTFLSTVYESLPFSVDLTFEAEYSLGGGEGAPPTFTYLPATLVTTTYDWASSGLTYTKLTTNSIRLSGASSYDFSTQYYKFVKTDYTTEVLPPPTKPPFNILYDYGMPVNKSQKLTYSSIFVTLPANPIGIDMGGIEKVDMEQWVHWSFASARAKVLFLRANGSIPITVPSKS